jgi:hypothetical protein
MPNPVRICKIGFIVLINGVAQDHLEDVEDTVTLLTQFDVMPIESKSSHRIASAGCKVFIEPCRRKGSIIFTTLRNIRTFAMESPCVPEQSNARV